MRLIFVYRFPFQPILWRQNSFEIEEIVSTCLVFVIFTFFIVIATIALPPSLTQ